VDERGRPMEKEYHARFSYKKMGLELECKRSAPALMRRDSEPLQVSKEEEKAAASADILVAFDIANA